MSVCVHRLYHDVDDEDLVHATLNTCTSYSTLCAQVVKILQFSNYIHTLAIGQQQSPISLRRFVFHDIHSYRWYVDRMYSNTYTFRIS